MTDFDKAEMLRWKALFGDKLTIQYGIREEHRNEHFAKNGSDWRGNLSFSRMIYYIYDGFYDLRFDPNRPWDYPPETREGVPVWGKVYRDQNRKAESLLVVNSFSWMRFNDYEDAIEWDKYQDEFSGGYLYLGNDPEIVACDPRNLQEPPI